MSASSKSLKVALDPISAFRETRKDRNWRLTVADKIL